MNILFLDTTDAFLTVAVRFDGVWRFHFDASPLRHSTTLMPAVDALVGARKHELGAIAVSVGPGSFTGIRIGVTTAKVAAFALGIPCLPFTSFALAAYTVRNTGAATVVLDAGNRRVYAQDFDGTRPTGEPRVLDGTQFAALVASGRKTIGAGADGALERIAPTEAGVAVLVEAALANGGLVGGDAVEPLYIQLSQAEKDAKL